MKNVNRLSVLLAATAMLSAMTPERERQPMLRNTRDSSKPGGSNPKARKRQAKRNAVKAARRRNRK